MEDVPILKKSQRGATLTGYAIILSTFTVMGLGAMDGLNSASETYLEETSDDIAASREISVYEELDEIPDPTGDGGDTDESGEGDPTYDLADGGQFESPADGLCMTLEGDGKFRQRECDGSAAQQISVYTNSDTGSSQLRIGGECIGLENNSASSGDEYNVQPCDDDNSNQLFRRNDVDQTWESASNRDPVMCLDVSGGGGEGHVVHQWSCHGGINQEWPDPAPYVPPFPGAPTPTVTGEGTIVGDIPGGMDFSPNQAPYTNDDSLFVFTESAIELDAPWTIDGTTLDAGTIVCSYIVWYSPVNDNEVAATIDFGAPVVGGSESTAELQSTDQFAAAGVDYQGYDRPWEGSDGFTVSGNTVGFTPYAVTNNADMVRVFTQCG